jgi:hypothetical protein
MYGASVSERVNNSLFGECQKYHNSAPPNHLLGVVEALQICIWEVLRLNLSRDTGYPDRGLRLS